MCGKETTAHFTFKTGGVFTILYGEDSAQEVMLHARRYSYTADDTTDTIAETCSCGHNASGSHRAHHGDIWRRHLGRVGNGTYLSK